MLTACRNFADFYMADIPPNAEIGVTRSSRRRKLVAESIAGWVLATEVDHTDIPYEYRIVLLATGEIYCDRGIGRLTNDYWAISEWFASAFERYGLTPWPAGIEDLRRLAIEFYLASTDSTSGATTAAGALARHVGENELVYQHQ